MEVFSFPAGGFSGITLFPHQKQYPLKPEANEGLKPIIENLKEQGLLIPCNCPCDTSILGVKSPMMNGD